MPTDVSPAALLGRQVDITPSQGAQALVASRRVVVTGGAGSIGSELVRQVLAMHPEQVFVVDHDESALHALQLELDGHGLLSDERWVLADIRDAATMRRLFADLAPHVVFHAAAHKHLPLLERYPAEAVKANILGTTNVVTAAVAAGAEVFVNVSTDKAARPTSVLGMTKRIAEMAVASHAEGRTRVASVRFGNVLGSRGSLLHGTAWQVRNGHPVTVTHPDVTRFFMTIPEAASLVVEAAVMAEHGETYVLDMGTPVRIVDLISRYVELSGAGPADFTFTGLRPGEKLHEELVDVGEAVRRTGHPQISCVRAHDRVGVDVLTRIRALGRLTDALDSGDVRIALYTLLADATAAPLDLRQPERVA